MQILTVFIQLGNLYHKIRGNKIFSLEKINPDKINYCLIK